MNDHHFSIFGKIDFVGGPESDEKRAALMFIPGIFCYSKEKFLDQKSWLSRMNDLQLSTSGKIDFVGGPESDEKRAALMFVPGVF